MRALDRAVMFVLGMVLACGAAMARPDGAAAHAGNKDPLAVHGCVQRDGLPRIVDVNGACGELERAIHFAGTAQLAALAERVTTLQTSVTTLEVALAAAQARLGCLHMDGPSDLVVEGCNLHVRSGSGSTFAAVNVYTRPGPLPARSARSWTVVPLITTSGDVCPLPRTSGASLLVAVTIADPGPTPASASDALTVATVTSACFGGQSVQPSAGRPAMTGAVLSIRIVWVFAVSWFPALSMATYVNVVVPSAVIATDPLAPLIVPPPVWAPLEA